MIALHVKRMRKNKRLSSEPPVVIACPRNKKYQRGGVRVEGRAWNERAADFGGFDAVVLRSNWDYHFEPDGSRYTSFDRNVLCRNTLGAA